MRKSPFIGYYGYWVVLTYLSVLSAVVGIFFAFNGNLLISVICLMISGLCDTFDGWVASKKDMDNLQVNYGIQIDAMADLISFGVLPATMLFSLGQNYDGLAGIVVIIIPGIYVLAALIRLAYFNATKAAQKGDNTREYFEGLPTTSVALFTPIVLSVCNVFQVPFFPVFSAMLAVVSVLFVLRTKVPKPRMKEQIILCLVGLIILIALHIIRGLISG